VADNNTTLQIPSFFSLFKFATTKDIVLMVIGVIGAVGNGIAFPLVSLLFGTMSQKFENTKIGNLDRDMLNSESLNFIWVGLGMFGCSFVSLAFWMIAGERQAIRYREEYFKALMNQEIGWHDSINPNEFGTKIPQETFHIENAIGEKVNKLFFSVICS